MAETSVTKTNNAVPLPNRTAYLNARIAEMRGSRGLPAERKPFPSFSTNVDPSRVWNYADNSFVNNQASGQVDASMRRDTVNDPVGRINALLSVGAGTRSDGSPANPLSDATQKILNGYYTSVVTTARERMLNSAGAGTRAFAELVTRMGDVGGSQNQIEYAVALDVIAQRMGIKPNAELIARAQNQINATIANERERGISAGNGILSGPTTPGRTAGSLLGAALGGILVASNPNQSFSGRTIPGFTGPVNIGHTQSTQRGGAWGNIMAGVGGFLRSLGQGWG
jgi:hypothetical protein